MSDDKNKGAKIELDPIVERQKVGKKLKRLRTELGYSNLTLSHTIKK